MLGSFPEKFSFYESGTIFPQEPASVLQPKDIEIDLLSGVEDKVGVIVDIFGSETAFKALMLLIFDQGLDASTYMEAGNILAGKMADHLAKVPELPGGVMISTPRIIDERAIRLLLSSQKNVLSRNYVHLNHGATIQICSVLIPIETKEGLDV